MAKALRDSFMIKKHGDISVLGCILDTTNMEVAIIDIFYGALLKLYGWDRHPDSRSTGSRDG